MKIGAQLDLVSPVSLVGIVDVYTVKGQRYARKWPSKPKQPNTPAQLAQRELFRRSIEWRKSLPAWVVAESVWKNINLPPHYSYDDLLRRSWWDSVHVRATPYPANQFTFYGFYITRLDGHLPPGTYAEFYPAPDPPHPYPFWYSNVWSHPAPDLQTIPWIWYVASTSCYLGKKQRDVYRTQWHGWDYGTPWGFTRAPHGGWWVRLAHPSPNPRTLCGYVHNPELTPSKDAIIYPQTLIETFHLFDPGP